MVEKVRINKYIANAGVASRRGADVLIEQGKVKVNGKIVKEPGLLVTSRDKIIVEGKALKLEKKEYYVFNKPPGYITSKTDPEGRKTIYDIIPESLSNLKPSGRLDKASSGLIIMTNDGELVQKLTHPSIKIPKVYRVTIKGKINQEDIMKLVKGIEIEKGQIAYAEVMVLGYEKGESVLEMTLYQGYNRQIRKMMDFIGKPVKNLKRISHATIQLTGLKRGDIRKIKPAEMKNLNKFLKKQEKEAAKCKQKD